MNQKKTNVDLARDWVEAADRVNELQQQKAKLRQEIPDAIVKRCQAANQIRDNANLPSGVHVFTVFCDGFAVIRAPGWDEPKRYVLCPELTETMTPTGR